MEDSEMESISDSPSSERRFLFRVVEKDLKNVDPALNRTSVKPQVYKYPEGDIYEGGWSKEGKRHGVGSLKFANGTMYDGRFEQGLFHGLGTLIFEDGSFYQGEFKEGYYNGHGLYARCDGMMFEGCFKDGRPHGPGRITFSDGSHGNPKQEGYFEGTRLVQRDYVNDALKKARLCAKRAKNTSLNNHSKNENVK